MPRQEGVAVIVCLAIFSQHGFGGNLPNEAYFFLVWETTKWLGLSLALCRLVCVCVCVLGGGGGAGGRGAEYSATTNSNLSKKEPFKVELS